MTVLTTQPARQFSTLLKKICVRSYSLGGFARTTYCTQPSSSSASGANNTRPPVVRSPSTLTTTRTMASDADYTAFLDKANRQRDAGSNQSHAESSGPSKPVRTETVEIGVRVPDVLKQIDTFYVSETDEPFEPVALKWEGASKGIWPGTEQFASLITSSKSATSDLIESDAIEILSPSSFDPKNHYTAVFKAVREAAAASDSSVDESAIDAKVFRVDVGKSRVEYWVLALDAADGKIVGLKAKAIES